jgi:hypothetical protein
MTDIAADLQYMRQDAARWPEFGHRVDQISQWGHALSITTNDEVELIREFLVAYNAFCATFVARGQAGKTAMTNIGTTLTSVANQFQAADTPH